MKKKTVLLMIYLLSLMLFLRSVFRILTYEGNGGYGMVIVSALVMTFVLRIYLKERTKDKEKLATASEQTVQWQAYFTFSELCETLL